MSNDYFQNKFKDQIQFMGKGGISSIQSNQPIQPYPNNNNYYIPQNNQNMINMNMNYPVIFQPNQMNYGNPNLIPNQMNINNQNNVDNNFSGWAEIYNKEQKNKKQNKSSSKINNRIKSGGEMIMRGNKNKEGNEKNKNKRQDKAVTPPPQNNNTINQYNQFQMNYMNPPMMMNNPNFNPYSQYQQMINPMNNYLNNNNLNQINMNNNFNNQIPMNNYNMNNNFNQQIPNNNINQINMANHNNNNESTKVNNSARNNKNYHFIEYKPYTLKDYKELTRSKIIMGPLGANIGTKEWEEKKAKMKRMETYSNRINQTHKGITKLKKDSPKEEIEKNLQLKKENSHRYRTYEYGKLIRNVRGNYTNSKMSAITGNNDNYYKDLGIINENEEFKLKTGDLNIINIQNNKDVDLNDPNNFMPLIKDTENINDTIHKINTPYKSNISNFEVNNNFDENSNNNQPTLQSLIQQNEDFKSKIDDIKNSLL